MYKKKMITRIAISMLLYTTVFFITGTVTELLHCKALSLNAAEINVTLC